MSFVYVFFDGPDRGTWIPLEEIKRDDSRSLHLRRTLALWSPRGSGKHLGTLFPVGCAWRTVRVKKMVPQSLSPHAEGKGTRKPGENTPLRRESAAPCVCWDKRCSVFLVDQKGPLKREDVGVRWSPNLASWAAWSSKNPAQAKAKGFPRLLGLQKDRGTSWGGGWWGEAALASRVSASEHPQPSMGVGGHL